MVAFIGVHRLALEGQGTLGPDPKTGGVNGGRLGQIWKARWVEVGKGGLKHLMGLGAVDLAGLFPLIANKAKASQQAARTIKASEVKLIRCT